MKKIFIEVLRDRCLLPAISLPLAPRINELYNPYSFYNRKTGKRVEGFKLSKEGRAYKKDIVPVVNIAIKPHMELIKAIRKDSTRKLFLSLECYYQEDRTDVDARVKSLQDALATCLGINDRRFIKDTVEKYVDKSFLPGMIVAIYEAVWKVEEQVFS